MGKSVTQIEMLELTVGSLSASPGLGDIVKTWPHGAKLVAWGLNCGSQTGCGLHPSDGG